MKSNLTTGTAKERALARKVASSTPMTEADHAQYRDTVLTVIAKRHLRLETLKARNSDSLDFFDCSVLELRDALKAAYEAGQNHKRPA